MRETEKGQTGYKKSPLDFALWKASKPGEPAWVSPWGEGRPGWHIECSAMVEKHLPGGADIHGGGTDLLFPHHENELAQSAGAHPTRTFVRAWAHHGMVNFVGDKMSKSVGNILDAKEAVELHGKNAVRMWLLQSHYSQPIDYSGEILEEKHRAYWRLQNFYAQVIDSSSSSDLDKKLATSLQERFDAAMDDDLNTPEAVAAFFEIVRLAGQEISKRSDVRQEFSDLKNTFDDLLGEVLGFELGRDQTVLLDRAPIDTKPGQVVVVPVTFRLNPGQGDVGEAGREKAREKAVLREKARREKDWPVADRLRDELHAEGWTVEDTPEGPILTRV
jgi:cysteinyl-tRNA synthetase